MKKIGLYLIGIVLTALGLAFILKSQFGASTWTAMNYYLSQLVGLTVGVWTYLTAIIVYLISSLMDKTWKNPMSILTIFLVGTLLDVWRMIIPFEAVHVNPIFTFTVGLLFFCFGVALNIKSTYPPAPYEQLPLVLSKKFKKSFSSMKMIVEAFAFTVAIVLGIIYGSVFEQIYFGTFIFVFTLGPIIQMFIKVLNR